ncbi:YlmH family RNA-binding protein [Radiobacillus deserti]|uniref:RNA-binding protein n=1 Tax=Radiobacillus deserti TaxID=2594883 RepID=A0A516KFI8_9BACI|nr:RNA-binding protein [Radiobacillus deserti]QDP40106.1 RNA-binding protein [Radiobacillus deserti]
MDLYQHFRKEEQPFIDQVLSWKEDVSRNHIVKLSDFLDPREQMIFSSLIGKDSEFKHDVFGGDPSAERKKAILAPFYEEITSDHFEIVLLEASYPEKFVTLEHRDVLGAFLSLGIQRKKLGDLTVKDGTVQIVVSSDISPYVLTNLTEIKKAKVQFKEVSLDNKLPNDSQWVPQESTISSLRLDVVLKETYRMSRQQANGYIQKGLVKVNFRTVEDPSFAIQQEDMISVRGKGRSRLKSIQGLTKKEKYKVTIEKLN